MAHSNQGDPTRNPCEDEEVLPGPGPGPDPDPGDPDPEPAVDPTFTTRRAAATHATAG